MTYIEMLFFALVAWAIWILITSYNTEIRVTDKDASWRVGFGTPTPDTPGNLGDFYLDVTSGNTYGPRKTNGWGSVVANLKRSDKNGDVWKFVVTISRKFTWYESLFYPVVLIVTCVGFLLLFAFKLLKRAVVAIVRSFRG